MITTVLVRAIYAQDSELKVDKIKPNVVRLSGARDAIYSPSSKLLAIQASSNFLLLTVQNLTKSFDNLSKVRKWNGQIIGFLPSETLIYSNGKETFALEPIKQESQKIFSRNLAGYTNNYDLTDKIIVIVSNDLIITGDGSYDWSGKMGNIFRYDLKRKRLTKGAKIPMFWYASLSPSGKYILYEHGAEDNNNTDLYDISRDKNYPISEYFNFKNSFPQYKETDETPLVWLHSRDRFLAEISSNDDNDDIDEKVWLALFDVPSRKVIWKKSVDKWFFPSNFQQLSDEKALLDFDDGVYELFLENGDLRKNSNIDGKQIAVSPNRKNIAFIKSNQLFVASPDGSNRKLILDLPSDWKPQTAYKGGGERPPTWSVDSSSLILFGENQLLFVQL